MYRRTLAGAGLGAAGLVLAGIQFIHAIQQTDIPAAIAVDAPGRRDGAGAGLQISKASASGLDPEGEADTQTCSVRSIYRSIVSVETVPAVLM